MTARRNYYRTKSNKKSRLSRFIRKIAWLVFIAAIICLISYKWLIPTLIRDRIERRLSVICGSPVKVGDFRINRSGQVWLDAISFYDKEKQNWLSIENTRAVLGNWPSFHPYIKEIEINGLNLQISSTNGKLNLPMINLPGRSADADQEPALSKITVKKAKVLLTDAKDSQILFDNLELSVTKTGQIYNFQLNQAQMQRPEFLFSEGRFDPGNKEFFATLRTKQQFTKAETNILFSILNMEGMSVEGDLEANIKTTGPLNQPRRWQPEGTVKLNNWIFEDDETRTRRIFNSNLEITSSGIHINNLSISDANGVELLGADRANVALDNWPGLNPELSEIEIFSPRIRTIYLDNKFIFPALLSTGKRSASTIKLPDIRRLAISNAEVVVEKIPDEEIVLDRIQVNIIKQKDIYNITVNRLTPDDSNSIVIKGSINPETLDVDMSLAVDSEIKKSETDLLFEAMNIPKFLNSGNISADLNIKGSIQDPNELTPAGIIKLKDCFIKSIDEKFLYDIDTIIDVNEQNVSLTDLAVRDVNGLEWLSAKSSILTLTNWPGPQPVLTQIDVSGLKLKASLTRDEQKLKSLLQTSESAKVKNIYIDLQKLNVIDASIDISVPNEPVMAFDNLELHLALKPDTYDVKFSRKTFNDPNVLNLIAAYNPTTSELELALQADMTVSDAETKAAQSLLNIPHFQTHGKFESDLTISGAINKPQTLQPKGIIRLSNWFAAAADGTAPQTFSTDIKFDGPKLQLENLAVTDANNLEWLSANTSNIILENWPGPQPVLTGIETDGLKLFVYLIDDKLRLPVNLPSDESENQTSDNINLQKLTISNALIGIANRKNSKLTFDSLSLKPAEQKGFYDVSLTYDKAQEPEPDTIRLNGVVNPKTTEARLTLQMNHKALKQETAVIFAALGIPEASGEGKLTADIKITGLLNEPSKLQSSGNVKLDQCTLYINNSVFAKNIITTGWLENKSLSFDRFDALVCNGPASGLFYIQAKQGKLVEYGGHFSGDKMSFVELTSIFGGPGKKASTGFVKLNYYFTADSNSINSLRGDGQLVLDNADITVIPIIPQLFKLMGLIKLDPLNVSDTHCAFGMTGPIVKVKSAHIANTFGAIEVEPGGTINLQKRTVDMYVITVPLRQLDAIARRIPFADIFFNLKDKLTRFYIRGQWSSPPTKLITKTPIKDIREGSVGFFKDIARNGGNFGRNMLERFGVLLSATQNNTK